MQKCTFFFGYFSQKIDYIKTVKQQFHILEFQMKQNT